MDCVESAIHALQAFRVLVQQIAELARVTFDVVNLALELRFQILNNQRVVGSQVVYLLLRSASNIEVRQLSYGPHT